ILLSVVTFAKSKSKTILVKLISQAGMGCFLNTKRSQLQLQEKLTLLHYDPVGEKKKFSLKKYVLTRNNE
uniref:Large ribosomal subunit protein bL33m n=1 Tax=Sus scrofa TaxID=9823 RepID=A0A4X1TRM3_PIG